MQQLIAAWRRWAATPSLRERCEALLQDLPIPAPFNEQTFCDALADRRGRPIALIPLSLRGEAGGGVLYGMAISRTDSDIIVYERDTSQAHRQQIIVHEACHLILGHRAALLSPSELPPLPYDIWAEEQIYRVLGRSDHAEEEEEHEAEILASLILEQAAISAPAHGCGHDAETTAMLVRLTSFYRLRKSA